MMNWARQQLANVAGIPEPIYGASAIQPVSLQAQLTPYTILKTEDLKWADKETTALETQTFYLVADSGHVGIVQVIHSNVAGIRKTSQFNTKIFFPKNQSKPHLWSSDQLQDVEFSDDKLNFYAAKCAIELAPDGKLYSIRSITNENSLVNLTITQQSPGFQVGQDGTTLYGTDFKKPWGNVRHVFWPRNRVEGTIVTPYGPLDFQGKCLFIHALQGMKPHHAAAKWNFVSFQGPTYTAILMEFTTPKSYGSTLVNVGGIVRNNEIVMANSDNSIIYQQVKYDEDNGWHVPETAKVEWKGKAEDGRDIYSTIEGSLGDVTDRIDVMAEVPGFVKQIVAGAVGTKPYIYQYCHDSSTLEVRIGDEIITEKGQLFAEATFIS